MFVIYGITHILKKESRERRDVCSQCSKQATISSFEGTKIFHLYGIPLVPMGRYQVIDMCSSCKRYLQIPVEKWKELKTTEMKKATDAYQQDATNPAHAHQLLNALTLFSTTEEINKQLQQIVARFSDDSGVLIRAAHWYRTNQKHDQAREVAEKILGVDRGHQGAHRILIEYHLQKKDAANALLHALSIDSTSDIRDLSSFVQISQALRKNTRPRDAYGLMQKLVSLYPQECVRSSAVQKEVRLLEKELSIQRQILAPKPLPVKEMVVIGGIAVLVLAIVIGANYEMLHNQKLLITNAFYAPMTVTVNQLKPVSIAPGEMQQVQIEEGQHVVEVALAGQKLPVETVEVRNTIFERFFNKGTFIFSPGGTAVIVREKIFYTAKQTAKPPEDEYELLTGHSLITLHGIDYAFVDPPAQLKLSSSTKSEKRIHAYSLNLDPYQLATLMVRHESIPVDDILTHMEGRMRAGQRDAMYVSMYQTLATRSDRLSRAEEFLATR